MKWRVGAVAFAESCPVELNSAGFRLSEPYLGAQRVEFLTKAMNGEDLPGGRFLVGQNDGGGYQKITRDDVDWEELINYTGPRT